MDDAVALGLKRVDYFSTKVLATTDSRRAAM
jgi:hypothetical protein